MSAFHDNEGREWLAEKVGRTSGILSSKDGDPSALSPYDIIRFSSTFEGEESVRETTLKAGTLRDLSKEELVELLARAAKIS